MLGTNNPLNIRSSEYYNWLGQTGKRKGFCCFSAEPLCYRAGAYLIMRSYRRRGVSTVRQIIETWAPPVENPTNNYVDFVCKWSALEADYVPSSVEDIARLLAAMTIFEQGIPHRNLGNFMTWKSKSIAETILSYNIKFQEK